MKTPPLCSAPDANVIAPDFTVPTNACDCHFHIFDTPSEQVLPRSYTARRAPLDELNRVHKQLGITRSVVVQPSIYGTDNRTTLSAVASTDSMKAIVVVDETESLENLMKLKNTGAVGCRINLLFKSNTQPVNLKSMAQKAAELDWHLQLLVDVSVFEILKETIKSLPVPVVFDHMGHMPAHKGINNPGFQQMLHLLGDGDAWVKLSAPYRICDGKHPGYTDVEAIVNTLIQTNPEQVVWGSDWPHPLAPHKMPNDTDLVNLLHKSVPNEQLRNQILVQNPERLYGF